MAERKDDEEDFCFWGTPVEQEVETRAGQHRKEVKDAAATRALPLHKQEVTDEQGRRRFHGAFTGGYSAGYFNTVGSKEGWQPSEFRSSREARAAVQQSVEQFLDEDELEDLRKTNLQTTHEYDTFGSTAAELARRAAADAAAERPSAIPGLMPEEMVAPVADSVGIRLLQKMGWRQGKGIGVGGDAPTPADEEAEEALAAAAATGGGGWQPPRPRRRWGQHAAVAADNTQLYLLAPKTDMHGLGHDPFKEAEDFRRIKDAAREAVRPGSEAGQKRRRGIAFGSGVLDEDDAFGIMDDYVTHDDVEGYEGTIDDDGLPRQRGPTVKKGGLGDRLARKGYSFEITEEEEEEEGPGVLGWHPAHPHRQQQYALPGRDPTMLLQSREQQVKNSLIPGFVRATITLTLTYFPPPRLPPGYVPVHRPSREAEAALPAGSAKFASPQAGPPADPELRQAIDSLAFFVARNGLIFENMARQRQQKEGRWAFLSAGDGAAYYRWKVHSLRTIIQPQHQQQQQRQQQQRQQQRPIGQRSAPLSADERGALLGEQPLAASAAASGWAAGAAAAGAAAAAASATTAGTAGARQGQQQDLRKHLLQVASTDRQRLQGLLSRNFVSAESQDMLQPEGDGAAVVGLRPGAAAQPPRPPIGPVGAKVVTEADLARSGGDTSADTSAAQQTQQAAGLGGGLALRPAGEAQQAQQARRMPERRSEEWRPAALLCKRLNVPDPYHGRPAELQMSRFKTDHLALPDTAAAVAASLASVPAGAQDFLLPPSVAAAIAEAEAKQQLQAMQAVHAVPPAIPSSAAAAPAQDASGAADAFLSSLSGMFGGGRGDETGPAGAAAGAGVAAGGLGGEAAPPLPPGPPPPRMEEEEEEAAAERPVDLFKAIFEDSEEDEEEEQQEADATAHSQQAQQQVASGDRAQQQQAQQQAQPHAYQHQQQQQGREGIAFGFAKLRDGPAAFPAAAAGRPAAAVATAAAAAAAASAAAASIDDALKQRVQDALRALKKDKKEKKEKRGSRKKEKKAKRKGSGKEKEKSRKRGKKEGKHTRRRGGSGSGSSSGGSSGSDSG